MDASPTKAWIVTRRDEDPDSFHYAVGRPPKYELYDIKADPHCMKNLATESSLDVVRDDLHQRLMQELKSTGDPRVSADVVFERSPYTDEATKRRATKK